MHNFWTETIKDELNQRCDEVTSFAVTEDDWIAYPKQGDDFLQRVCEYIFFIKSTPELLYYYNELLSYYSHRIKTVEVQNLLRKASDLCESIGKTRINHNEYLVHKNSRELNDQKWKNPFDEGVDSISANEFVQRLSRQQDFTSHPIQKIQDIIQILCGDELPENGILFQISEPTYRELESQIAPLRIVVQSLNAHLLFEPTFVGQDEVIELERAFRFKYPMTRADSGERLQSSIRYNGFRKEDYLHVQHAARRVNRVLIRKLLERQNRALILWKLKAYMEWFLRITDTGMQLSENKLANEVAKFIFPQGYFPFVRFKTGRKEPDMHIVSERDEMLIELKKYTRGANNRPTEEKHQPGA